MKPGLDRLPQLGDLSGAYDRLQFQSPSASDEQSLALYSQWTRFDARLAEIWIGYVSGAWKSLDPMKFHSQFVKQPWPSVAGVLLEFVKNAQKSKAERTHFNSWKQLVLYGIDPAPWQLFFISGRGPGSASMREDAELSLGEFRKWGYLSRDQLVRKKGQQTLAPEVREKILARICRHRGRITVQHYWDAIDHAVSRRQAERDLLRCIWLKPVGATRGREYRVIGARKPPS
jgi:hypothetical protein